MLHIADAHIDARAEYRDRGAPTRLQIVQVPARPAIAAITDAVNTQPMPAVLVTASGKIWQLTAGGSGIVWVQADGRFTAPQRAAIDKVTAGFEAEWPQLAKPKPAQVAPPSMTGVVSPTREALNRMVGISEEAGMYEATTPKPRKKRAAKKQPPTVFTLDS